VSERHGPARPAEVIARPAGGVEASRPIAADRAWWPSHPADQGASLSFRRASAALDPVEFAEQLRAVLLDDARRHGIEV